MRESFDVPFLHRLRVLLRLAEAQNAAEGAGADVWQYSVPIDVLRNFIGVSNHALRRLVSEGLVEYRLEKIPSRSRRRGFLRNHTMKLTGATCFVLTAIGVRYVQRLLDSLRATDERSEEKPRWNAQNGKWTFCGKLVKQLGGVAKTQRLLLDACQLQGWGNPIKSPWADRPMPDRSRHLRRALDHLKSEQQETHIGFSSLDKARSFRWFPVE